MGVPVIATKIGGVRCGQDGLDGILIKEGVNAEELAEVMLGMISEKELWGSRKTKILNHAREVFDYRRVASQIEGVVEELLISETRTGVDS